jgi:Fe2+ transport system protein B
MKRALIIEDNENNMELITFILEANGFRTLQAETGMRGLEIAEAERPDVILQVGDEKNLARTLRLTLELSELEIPMVLALNMADEARERGIRVDRARLEKILGIPVVGPGGVGGEGRHEGKEKCR